MNWSGNNFKRNQNRRETEIRMRRNREMIERERREREVKNYSTVLMLISFVKLIKYLLVY